MTPFYLKICYFLLVRVEFNSDPLSNASSLSFVNGKNMFEMGDPVKAG